MHTYIGIDLGTSGMKLLLADGAGTILAQASEEYAVSYPHDGWSEQDPEDWERAAVRGLQRLLEGQDASAVRGISFSGQMHGLVVLDDADRVIRPCILWNDGRTEKQTAYLNEQIGRSRLSALTGNIAFAGFTAPKILWMRENEPENFSRIRRIMLPKDYLAYRLSGAFCTDYSDASGMLLLDVRNRKWSQEMCEICGISVDQLPQLHESNDAVGTLKPEYAQPLGLSDSVQIVMGAGDNAAAAIGTGTVEDGSCNVSLGTSGTIFIASDRFVTDDKNSLHSFCHANGKWHLMGCILSAASCRKWWLEDILGTENYEEDEKALREADTEGLYFLPYLMGERSPHNNVNARGAFIGLSASTTRAQMSRAVMEGVAFAIRDCLEVARQNGVCPAETGLCGGGARSGAWRQIMADVLNIPVRIFATEQGPAYGAAILAMVGCGEYESVQAAVRALQQRSELIPVSAASKSYQRKYEIFHQLYPALEKVLWKH